MAAGKYDNVEILRIHDMLLSSKIMVSDIS